MEYPRPLVQTRYMATSNIPPPPLLKTWIRPCTCMRSSSTFFFLSDHHYNLSRRLIVEISTKYRIACFPNVFNHSQCE